MKKLSLLLFIAGLFIVGLSNTNCTRKEPGVTPITGDTQTVVKIDSSGEDVDLQIFNGSLGGAAAPGATVILVNNYDDLQKLLNNHSYFNSKTMIKHTCNGQGQDTFFGVKPHSNPPNYFPDGVTPYNYQVLALYAVTAGDTLTGTNGSATGNPQTPIEVAINNASKGVGVKVAIGVQ